LLDSWEKIRLITAYGLLPSGWKKDNQLRFYFGFESKPKRNGASDLVYDPDGYFEQAPKHLFNVDPSSIEENAYCHRCGKDVVLVHGECSDCELYFAKKYDY